jgi:hypothetical protein
MHQYGRVGLFTALICSTCAALGAVGPVPDLIEITESSIYRWNINASGTIYARSMGTSLFGDMARTNDGRYVAYRTTYGGYTPALFQVDPDTGAGTLLVQSYSAANKVVALAPMRNGLLLGCDSDLGWISIDPATLAYTSLNISGPRGFRTGGMATSPQGEIYAWCSGSTSTGIFSKLYRIDPMALTAEMIGGYDALPASNDFQAMAFTPDGRLFGFSEINGGINGGPLKPNGIYQLDLQTGMPALIGQRQELADARGVVFVPEPGMTLIIATGLALVPAMRRTKEQHELYRRRMVRSTDSQHSHAIDSHARPVFESDSSQLSV